MMFPAIRFASAGQARKAENHCVLCASFESFVVIFCSRKPTAAKASVGDGRIVILPGPGACLTHKIPLLS